MKEIIEVYRHNFIHEFSEISKLMQSKDCGYVAIDTEFPGFVYRSHIGASDLERYRDMKLNVDTMKIIQLGLTFYSKHDRTPYLSWQVNFKEFDPAVDTQATNSIQLLRESGIDFKKNAREGVDAVAFSRLLWRKLVHPYRGRMKWITFHGSYDLAYIVKLLMQTPLPNTLPEFLGLVRTLLGNVYDVKYMAKFYGFHEHMGLMKIAEKLGINWEGRHHQAGHDSLLIGEVFWRIKQEFGVNEDNFVGLVHGADMCNLMPMGWDQYLYHRIPMPTSSYFARPGYFRPATAYPGQFCGFFLPPLPYYGQYYSYGG